MHNLRIGRITVALALVFLGANLLADNLLQTDYTGFLLRLWPVILIALGLEYLLRATWNDLRGGHALHFDAGGIALLLVILALIGAGRWANRATAWIPPFWNWFDVPRTTFHSNPPGTPLPAGAAVYTAEREATLAVKPSDSLKIEMDAGRIHVTGDSPDGKVHARLQFPVHGLAPDVARELGESVELKVTEGPLPSIRVLVNDRTLLGAIPWREPPELTVQVPESLGVFLVLDAGALQVTDLQGNVQIQVDAGQVVVERIGGNVEIESDVANIRVADVQGRVIARTDPGSIQAVRFGGGALESQFGNIQAEDWQGALRLNSETGSVRATTRYAVTENLDVQTSVGSVDLTLPRDSSAQFYLRANVGSIQTPPEIPVVRREGPTVEAQGVLGDGRAQVRVETGTGRVAVHLR